MKRLNFFPTPYPDECLYSIFARYCVRSGIFSLKAATRQFFDCSTEKLASTVFLPIKMGSMDYWFDPETGLTPEEIVFRHTAYNYMSVAFTDEVFQGMEEAIRNRSGDAETEHLEVWMTRKMYHAKTSQYLRYCPECAAEDKKKYGEAYWHRLPQLPGVCYCPKHKCMIMDSSASFKNMRGHLYPASHVLCDEEMTTESGADDAFKEEYLAIARDTEWLLEHGREFRGYRNISLKYRSLLQLYGYADFYGTTDRTAVRRGFEEIYSETFLREFLHCNDDPYFWLRYLQLSIGFNLNSIQHVLLMEFFAGSAENFQKMEAEPGIPYGSEMSPCINRICPQYMKDTAKRVKLRKHSEEIWAWFECPYCGLRYRRSNPEQSFEEYLETPCITDQGFLFRQELERYLRETTLSMMAISKKLYVGQGVVIHYVKEHGIDVSNRSTKGHFLRDKSLNETGSEFYHRRVSEELDKTPVMSCKDLKEKVPGAYNWFMCYDPEWIHERLINELDKPRWQEWGEQVLIQLQAAYEEIRRSGDPRKRITISWLARVAGINRDLIYGRLRYLPKMQEFFDQVCEPQEDWIRRRYTEVALEKKAAGGKEFTYDDVKRKVQIRRDSYVKHKQLIEDLIEELNNTLFA